MKTNSMRIILKQVSVAVALFALVACSESTPDHSHKTGAETRLVQEDMQWSFPPAVQADIDAAVAKEPEVRKALAGARARIAAINAELKAAVNENAAALLAERRKVVNELYASAVAPYEHIILNPNYVGDGALNKTQEMRLILRRFNEGLVQLVRHDSAFVEELGILPRYWKAASIGCQMNRSGCRALDFIGGSADSSEIFEAYAWDIDSRLTKIGAANRAGEIGDEEAKRGRSLLIKTKFDVLRLAMKMRNASEDRLDRLAILWLMSGTEFEEIPSAFRSEEFTQQTRRVSTRITQALPRRLREENYRTMLRPYIERKQIWRKFSLRDNRSQVNAYGSMQAASELAKVACQFFRESAGMAEAIDGSLKNADALGQVGFLAELKQFTEGDQGVIFANVRMNQEFVADEQLFLIDQLFRGHWDGAIAETCWLARRAAMKPAEKRADTDRFLVLIQNYIRVELLKRVIKTNRFMSTVFQPLPGEQSISSRDTFYRAIDESRALKGMWQELIVQVDIIDQFVRRIYGSSERNLEKTEQQEKLALMIKSLRTNIKLLAVYPNMLVLSYYLAAKNFSITIETWWGSLALDAEMVINWIFGEGNEGNKTARPLFDFGNDSRPIMTFENLYAFFFALKTNTFNTFANADAQASRARGSGEKIINDINFFAEIIQRFINKEYNSLKGAIETLEDEYLYNEQYEMLKRVCRAEANGGHGDGSASYRINLTLADLRGRTFIGYGKKEVGEAISDTYGQAGELVKSREELYRKYLFISTMVDILEEHWRTQLEMAERDGFVEPWQMKLSVANYVDAENKLAEIRNYFDPMLDVVRRYHQFVLKHHRELGDCVTDVVETEIRQQHALYEREIAFLRAVYAALKEMHARVAANPGAQAEIEAEYTDAVNGKPTPARPDAPALARVAALANTGYEGPNDILDNHDEMSIAGGYTYSRWNNLLRVRNNLQEINPRIIINLTRKADLSTEHLYYDGNKPDYRVSKRYEEGLTEYEFVRSILTAAQAKEFVQWVGKRSLHFPSQRLDTMVELYLSESLGVLDSARRGCKRQDDREACQKDKSLAPVTAREIIASTFKMAEMLHIDHTEEKLLRLLNERTKFPMSNIQDFLLDERKRPHSLMEVPYKRLAAKQKLLEQAQVAVVAFNAMLAVGSDDEETGGGAGTDWANRESGELMFLADRDSVRRITRSNYRPIVVGSIERVRRFEKAVECYADADTSEIPSYRYEIDLQNPRAYSGNWLNPFNKETGRVEYIEAKLRTDFNTVISKFRQETKRVYDAQKGDPDFGVGSKVPSCVELLKD